MTKLPDNDIYALVSHMVLTKVSPDAWRAESCETMTVEIHCPKVVQDEIAKLAAMWNCNQADLEKRLFSALVRDGIWFNIEQDNRERRLQ